MEENPYDYCPSGRPADKGFYDLLYQESEDHFKPESKEYNVIFSCKPSTSPAPAPPNGECKLLLPIQNNIGVKCPSYIPLSKQEGQDGPPFSSTGWCGGAQQPLPSSGCPTNQYPFARQCCACGSSPSFVVNNKQCRK